MKCLLPRNFLQKLICQPNHMVFKNNHQLHQERLISLAVIMELFCNKNYLRLELLQLTQQTIVHPKMRIINKVCRCNIIKGCKQFKPVRSSLYNKYYNRLYSSINALSHRSQIPLIRKVATVKQQENIA